MRVIPICSVERNLSGSFASFQAVLADLFPFLASAERRDLRADISATSDIAKTPLSNINPMIIDCSL